MSGRSGRPIRPPAPPPQPLYTPPPITPPPPDPTDNFRPVRERAPKSTITGLGAKGNIPLAYGRQRLPGDVLFVYRQTEWTVWLVVGICRGEIDSLVGLTVNDKPPSFFGTSLFEYWFYPGTPAGTVDANLAAALPGWNEALPGVAYAVVKLQNWRGNWPSVPPQMRWEIKGLKCYDLSNLAAAKVYSENLWVQDYDYMRHPDGKALPQSAIYTPDWIAARDIANEVMADGAKRYEYHPLIRDDISVDDELQKFCVAGDGYRWRDGSQFRLFVDRPAVASGTLGDGALVRQAYSLERSDPFTRPNHVIVNFTDEQDAWNENPTPEEAKTAAALAGTEDLVTVTHSIPGIHRRSQAKRKAIFLLNNVQFDARLKRRERATGVSLSPGDVKTVQLAAKGINQAFRVVPVTKNPDHTYEVELLEYDAARYSDTVVADASKIKSTLPDYYATPPFPGNCSTSIVGGNPGVQTSFWDAIPVRVTPAFGAGYWSTANCAGVTLGSINNGTFDVAALNFNAAGKSEIVLDLGVGNAKAFRDLVVSMDGDEYLELHYSDDGAAWTAVSSGGFGSAVNCHTVVDASGDPAVAGWVQHYIGIPSTVGARRFWRIRQLTAGASVVQVAEVQFYEWNGTWPYAKTVIVSPVVAGSPALDGAVVSVDVNARRAETTALGYYNHHDDPPVISSTMYVNGQVHVLSKAGVVGWGIARKYSIAFSSDTTATWGPDYIAKGQYSAFLGSGTFNNVALPSTAALIEFTGLTAACTVTGLLLKGGSSNAGEGGREFVILNGSPTYNLTLAHEDAGSTAANRFSMTQANGYTLQPGESVVCVYDATASRFRITNPRRFGSGNSGLVPGSGGGTINFMRADGTWAAPPGATNLGYTASTRVLTSDTGADVTLPLVSSADPGLAPASGGGTTNFLRADGSWAAPGGGSSPPFADTTAVVKGSVDASKQLRFEVDGFTAGATRVLTPPNADATIAGLGVAQTFSAQQQFDGNVKVGSTGSIVKNIWATTKTYDFGSVLAQYFADSTNVTVTGAAPGDIVIVTPPYGFDVGLIARGLVVSADTVCVRVYNYTAGNINPASTTFAILVIDVT